MQVEKQRTLMYIINDRDEILYVNKDLLALIPDIKIGNTCYHELSETDEPVAGCPNRDGSSINKTYYCKKLNEWFSTEGVDCEYKGKDALMMLLRPLTEDTNTTLNHMLHHHGFDVLAEVDLNKNKYQILKSHPMLDGLKGDKLSDLIQIVAQTFIESFDFYRFKKFLDSDAIKERFNKNSHDPICNNFRLKNAIKRAEWVHIEILPSNSSNDYNKVLITVTFIKTSNLRPGENEERIDDLTGLLVAPGYLNKIESVIKSNLNIEYAIASIDIDHFKIFNEWYGLTAGDVFLRDLGHIFKGFDEDFKTYSGYLGNDNFAILLPNDLDLINELKNRLLKACKSHGDGTGFLPSIGIYLIEDKTCSVSQMLDRATIAASTLKDGMANRLNYYSSSMMSTMESEYKLLHDAINSIKNDEFVIYFQPKVKMNDNKIFAAEALVRWRKNGKIVPPNDFIPVLEKTGSIVELDTYVWEKTMMWLKSLIDRGIKPVPISVNVSRIDLYYLDVYEIFVNLSKKHQVPPQLVEIEITESTYAEKLENIQKIVDKLRSFGFKIALDDFGAGYSSLNSLKSISVDVLKLDIKFLQFDDENKKKAISILESVINMINSLDLTLICEGVETKDAVEVLRSLGCNYAQGFYYYKPMPLSSFEQFLVLAKNIDYHVMDEKKISPIKFKEFLNYLSYSDILLDNILGPVAFMSYDGDNIEILKVNQSFSNLTGINDIEDNNSVNYIKSKIYFEDMGKITELFKEALKNPLKGAENIVRFEFDGKMLWFEIKIFFLDEKDSKRFYFMSCHDETDDKKLIKEENDLSIIGDSDHFKYDLNKDELIILNSNIKGLGDFYKDTSVIENFPHAFYNSKVISKITYDTILLYKDAALKGLNDNKILFDVPLYANGDLIWLRVQARNVISGDNRYIEGMYYNINNEIIYKANPRSYEAINLQKEKSIYSALCNLTDNLVYSINKKKSDGFDRLFSEAHNYDKLIDVLIGFVTNDSNKNELLAHLDRNKLIDTFKKNKHSVEFDFNISIDGIAKDRHIAIYMYEKDNKIYSYLFLDEDKDEVSNLRALRLEDSIDYISIGVMRYDLENHRIAQINEKALEIYGYDSVSAFNDDLKDDFSNRVLDEDKPGLFIKRKSLTNYGDTIDLNYRIFVDDNIKHIRAQEQYINSNGHEYIQRLFLDITREINNSLRIIDDDKRKLNDLTEITNYTKSILIGINKLYVSSYTCDIKNNKYEALKYSKQMSELISMSSTWEEFMMNYAKCYVHSEHRYEFLNKTSLAYISKHITYEHDRISVRYKRLADGGFKWYKMYIIASSFDDSGSVDHIIFAVRDIDNDTKTKEIYEERIEYYKDLFLNSSVDVYSGMLLIDLESLETKDIVFNGSDVIERKYNDDWDKIFYRVLNRVEETYRNEVGLLLSPTNIKSYNPGFSKTVKYRIDLGHNGVKKSRFVSTTVRMMDFREKKLATLFTIDITDDIRALEAAESKSDYDIMTGLYNRKRLDYYKEKIYPRVEACAVVFMDINGLKKTNDSLGHKAGDALIKTAASAIIAVKNEHISAYRYGGDEFLLICEDYNEEMVKSLLESFSIALDKCNAHANIICSMSIGYTVSKDNKSLSALILEADKDMYQDKLSMKHNNLKKKLEGDKSRVSSLLKYLDTDYIMIYEIDLQSDRYRTIHVNRACPDRRLFRGLSYEGAISKLINNIVIEDQREKMLKIFSINELKKSYLDKKIIKIKTEDNNVATVSIQAIEFEGGEAKTVILGELRRQEKYRS